ncbi:MAG TPA: hypothetical protein VGR07_03580 [Thermoanaerobaculia bacterium]|jgi:hypothetical protein|nr:hypothetical protein [Thermoanaerobaculia bacterium]
MPRHDPIFKGLLRSFFADLLKLAVPDLAARLDLAHPVLLDKEFFTLGGRRRELDLLVQVSFLGAGGHFLLVHVEVEARARPDMGRRLWRYRRQIQAVHDSHVLSLVVYLQRGRAGVQVQAIDEDLLGAELAPFRYVAFGLAGCDPAEYLGRPEPLAWGLAALMRRGTLTRPVLKLACLRRIVRADLDQARRVLLVDCVEAYLELNPEELAEYSALSAVRENREVRAMATTWSERIAAQGREEGLQEGLRALRKVLLSLLEQRFGPLPDEARARVEAISSLERLTRLSERALTARTFAALKLH